MDFPSLATKDIESLILPRAVSVCAQYDPICEENKKPFVQVLPGLFLNIFFINNSEVALLSV